MGSRVWGVGELLITPFETIVGPPTGLIKDWENVVGGGNKDLGFVELTTG